jgi:HK97 family phage prohead protease
LVASGERGRAAVETEAKGWTPGDRVECASSHSPLNTDHSPLLIEGYASLWGVADLAGDVVVRGAFADSLKRTGAGGVRMLHQHESRAVVGVWDEIVEDEHGLFVRGRIADWSAEARYARALARAEALDGLSIGFRAVKARRDGRLRVLSGVDLQEVSLVTFPMLPGARFSAKSGPYSRSRPEPG